LPPLQPVVANLHKIGRWRSPRLCSHFFQESFPHWACRTVSPEVRSWRRDERGWAWWDFSQYFSRPYCHRVWPFLGGHSHTVLRSGPSKSRSCGLGSRWLIGDWTTCLSISTTGWSACACVRTPEALRDMGPALGAWGVGRWWVS
jgi:hypothetical protein